MKPIKTLSMDNRPDEQPDGTYPFGKNGIQSELNGAIINEPGILRMAHKAPYRPIGIIETDSKPVIFSTDNTSSAIGYLNIEKDTYEPIIDDATWTLTNSDGTRARLKWKMEYYIRGQAQRNYKGEMVVAFTNKQGSPDYFPYYLNCDNPNLKSLDDMRLFPYYKPPTIDLDTISGGSVTPGAYYVAIGYEKNDGTSAPYSAISNVIVVTPNTSSGVGATVSDQAIQIRITNADTNYDFMRVAIISRIGGVYKAVELVDYQPVTSAGVTFLYTGENFTNTIDINDVLVKPAIYTQVDVIGQLNDYEYLAGLKIEPDYNDLQPYAATVQIEWTSNLIDGTAPPEDHKKGKTRFFMHEEVYAVYIRYNKTRGGKTKWFIIPGVTPTAADLANSTEATAGQSPTPVPKFKVEDTISYFDVVTKTGKPGVWQNAAERYPDTPDFDATALGGRNLRNQLVMHHKMPTIRWCRENLYKTDVDYGKTKLDGLGLRALNVRIPDKYKGLINGYELGFAKRTIGNSTVYGQSVLLHGVISQYSVLDRIADPDKDVPIYTSGGNWKASPILDRQFDHNKEMTQVMSNTFRFHAFDILFNKPAIEPTFLSSQLKLRRENIQSEGYLEDGAQNGPGDMPIILLVDYTLGVQPQAVKTGEYLAHIKDSFYLTNTMTAKNFVNARHENCFAGYLENNGFPVEDGWHLEYHQCGLRNRLQDNSEPSLGAPAWEETFLINLIAVKSDLYANFYSQTIVSAGSSKPFTDITPFYGGDTFVSDYTFHTYGRHAIDDFTGDSPDTGIQGKKVIRRIVCETVSNVALRYEIPGNIYSQWYPHNSAAVNSPDANYMTYFQRSQDPNQFGYTRDFNALNDLETSTIYNPFREEITEYPYRIHRGGKASRSSRPRSWRTFLPLDFYEMQKNMGHFTNLEGMDDRLLIHMENALFLTQDKAKLESDSIAVTLGSGDIFQFEPQEGQSAKLGYAGSQHDLACVRTPAGYIFVDAKQGEIYLYKAEIKNLNAGVNAFLREYLKVKEVNVFNGNGITIGWDQKYKRFLLTVKNKHLANSSTPVKYFEDTDNFWNNLHVGDIVYYQGRYTQYMGVNNSQYQCPPDPPVKVYTWVKLTPYCVVDSTGKNTGFQAWQTRARLTNGVLDGYQEPNSMAGGLGPYFPPVKNLTACPQPAPVITWIPTDPICTTLPEKSCEAGYILSPDGTSCDKVDTVAATPPSGTGGGSTGLAYKVQDPQWNNGGARVFAAGYNTDGSGVVQARITTPHLWVNGTTQWNGSGDRNTTDSRMNYAGIWVDASTDGSNVLPVNEWIGFSRKFTVTASKTIWVMLTADNKFKFSHNGVALVTECKNLEGGPNFGCANIYPITLTQGVNYVEMWCLNENNVAGMACEIYDCTLSQLQTFTTNAQLDAVTIFSTKDMVGDPFDLGETVGWSCPDGYSLDTSGTGDPVCVKNDSKPPITNPGNTVSGYVHYNTRCRKVDGVLDGFCEPNIAGGQGPLFPDVLDTTICKTEPPAPPSIDLAINFKYLCSDNGCKNQGGVGFTITLSRSLPQSITLWFGQLWKRSWDPQVYYTGDETGTADPRGPMFIPPAGSLPHPFYYTDPKLAFQVTIPANTTSVVVGPTSVNDGGGGGFISQRPPGDQTGLTPWICHNCDWPKIKIFVRLIETTLNDGTTVNFTATLSFTNGSGTTIQVV